MHLISCTRTLLGSNKLDDVGVSCPQAHRHESNNYTVHFLALSGAGGFFRFRGRASSSFRGSAGAGAGGRFGARAGRSGAPTETNSSAAARMSRRLGGRAGGRGAPGERDTSSQSRHVVIIWDLSACPAPPRAPGT
jgi:hypothetical protein